MPAGDAIIVTTSNGEGSLAGLLDRPGLASPSPGAGRLDYLDAMRGIAAMLVVFFHFVLATPPPDFGVAGGAFVTFISDYLDLGRIGVVLFFAISGFIIPNSLDASSPIAVRKFVLGRFFRLYPLYWFSLLLCLALGPQASPYVVAANLTMIQGFLLAPEINGAAWTLAIELVFYGLCLCLFLCGRLHQRRSQFLILVASLCLAVALAVARFLLVRKLPVALPLALSVMSFGTLWRGVVLDRDALALRYARLALVCFLFGIPMVCVTAYTVDFGFHEWPLPYIVSYGAGLLAFLAGTSWVRNSPPWLTHLGVISYSVYLLHTPVMMAVNLAGCGPQPNASPLFNWASVFTSMALVVVASHFSYFYVERPFVTLGRRLTGRPQAASATSSGR